MTRHINLISEISDLTFIAFKDELRQLESESDKPIYIDLSSEGGDAYAALSFAALLRMSKCDTIITGYGLIASAAVLVLASGTKRRMTKESWVMVHEDSGRVKGELKLMEVEVKHMREMETQWCKLLADVTTTSFELWTKLHKRTTYLGAKQCLDLGLIDEVV